MVDLLHAPAADICGRLRELFRVQPGVGEVGRHVFEKHPAVAGDDLVVFDGGANGRVRLAHRRLLQRVDGDDGAEVERHLRNGPYAALGLFLGRADVAGLQLAGSGVGGTMRATARIGRPNVLHILLQAART